MARVAALLGASFVVSAGQAAFYSVSATGLVQGGGRQQQGASGSGPQQITAVFEAFGNRGFGGANTDRGFAAIVGQAVSVSPNTRRATGAGQASASWTDIVVTNGAGTNETIAAAMRFSVSGQNTFSGGTGRSDFFTYTVSVTQNGTTTSRSGDIQVGAGTGTDGLGDQTLNLPSIQTNVAFSASFTLEAGCSVAAAPGETMAVNNTTSVITLGHASSGKVGRSVFELPDGFTANSIDAAIVNNTWQPVPEPASMTALALMVAGVIRRRKRA